MNKNIRQKFIISAALMIAATASAFAQGNGLAGINEATSMVSSYFDPGTKLIYAIGAVVGLIGGVKVYGKFSSGDPDTSKTAASTVHCWSVPAKQTLSRWYLMRTHHGHLFRQALPRQ